MIGACLLTLRCQGEQLEQGVPGAFCAQQGGVVRVEIGGLDRNAEAHEAAIGHDDMARALRRMTD